MKKVILMGILLISIACGGGGGGASDSTATTSTSSTDSFYVVDYSEQTLNNPSLSAEFKTSFSAGALTGVVDSTRTLQAVAMSNETEVIPQIKIALKTGAVSSTVITSKYNVVVYGLLNSASAVMVGMYQIDFSTSPTAVVSVGGLSNNNSTALLNSGTITGDLTLSSDGKATYDTNWSGAFSSDLKTFLFTNSTDGKLLMLGSTVSTHAVSEIEGTKNTVLMLQYADPAGTTDTSLITSGSGAGTVIYQNALISPTITYTRSNSNISVPTGARNYNLAADTSILEIKSTDTSSLTENGYIGSSSFFVMINPDSISRPAFSIIFL